MIPTWGTTTGVNAVLNSADLYLPLTHSLVAYKAAASATPTFTRATTTTVTGNEGILRTAIAGEARFVGARRVYNQIPAAGTGSASLAVAANKTMTLTAGTYIFSMGAGTGTATFSGTGGATGTLAASASARTSVVKTVTAGTFVVTASVATLVDLQVEDITGRTDQTTPSEYVSVGALDYRSTQDPLYLSLPGSAGHYASTPDSVAASVTGDIDIRVKAALTDWTPAAIQCLAIKDDAALQRSYEFYVNPVGTLGFVWFESGGASKTTASTAITGITDGQTSLVRVTLDVDNGAAGNTVTFYKSSDGATWTQIGNAVVTAGVTNIKDTTAILELGSIASGATLNLNGKIFSAQIYNTIGGTTPVVDFNPQRDAITPTGTITSSTTGEVWTINGASSVVRNAAYHGAGVDGVEYFNTDLTGAAIPADTNLGYLAEAAATNLCLQSNAFTTTWAAGGTPAATQNVVGPDGATSAWTLTDNDAGSFEYVQQDVTLTAATYTTSVFIKKTTGTQASYPVIFAYSGVAARIAICTVDTTNGTATVWTSYTGVTLAAGLTARCTSFNTDFWRVELSYTGAANAWSQTLIPAGATTGTFAGPDISNTAQGSAVFYGAQVELGSAATSYIPTTTVAVTRNADVLTYPSAGNIDGTVGWCYAEFDVNNDSDTNQNIIIGSDVAVVFPLYAQPSLGNVRTLDGTNAPIAQSAPMTGVRRGAGTWGGSTLQAAHNGVVSTTTAFDGAMNVTAVLRIGEDNAGNSHMVGTMRNVRIGQRQLSSSELQAITRP